MLKYCLVRNLMKDNTDNYVAHVSSPENKELDDVINYMLAEGSGLTRPQALAYFEKLTETILHFVGEGHSVTTPLFCARPTISGSFESLQDNFDDSRHDVKIRMSAGTRCRKIPTAITIKKVDAISQIPLINTFIDGASGQTNSVATSGNIGKIFGKQLKFDPTDTSQGVYFISVDDPSTVIRTTVYSIIYPTELHFSIPLLAPGEYIIKVIAASRSKKHLNSGSFKQLITVLS